VEVDRVELNRLVLEGFNMDYEEKKSSKQDLTFEMLESKLKNVIGIDDLSIDILKTLKLFNKEEGYNLAGALLSDDNSNEFAGIDIVKFGKDINKILNRNILKGNSVLVQYDSTVEIFERYYQYEEIEGYNRITREMIPKEAFREALANAIVHRIWDVKTNIQISMFDDRIEIVSPGGLMNGISEEDYFKGNISVLRNPILADVFYRLNLIEKFGTGITRIIKEYRDSIYKPRFEIGLNNIKVILPVVGSDESLLSEDETLIYNILKSSDEVSRMQLDNMSGFNKAKTIRTVNNLLDKNIVKKQGKGPKTTYTLDE
jgi:ATP-dependent DNA helicase RecG